MKVEQTKAHKAHWNSGWHEGMKCENEDCNNDLSQDDSGNLCSAYEDRSEGERWCNCCSNCRAQCHDGRIDEDIDKRFILMKNMETNIPPELRERFEKMVIERHGEKAKLSLTNIVTLLAESYQLGSDIKLATMAKLLEQALIESNEKDEAIKAVHSAYQLDRSEWVSKKDTIATILSKIRKLKLLMYNEINPNIKGQYYVSIQHLYQLINDFTTTT